LRQDNLALDREKRGVADDEGADKGLDVNDMFNNLTADGEIEACLNTPGPATDNPCVERRCKERL
jgi:hypothetical protein